MKIPRTALATPAAAACLALAACGGATSPHAAAATHPSTPTLPAKTTSAAPTSSAAASPSTTSRGTIRKQLGQIAGIGADINHLDISFAVDSIGPAACDGDQFDKPTGTLVAVKMRLSTAPGADLSQDGPLAGGVNPADWQFVGSDGVTHTGPEIADAASYGCLKAGEAMINTPLAPGSSYVGTVVLDLPATHGALIFSPGTSNASGWEWDF